MIFNYITNTITDFIWLCIVAFITYYACVVFGWMGFLSVLLYPPCILFGRGQNALVCMIFKFFIVMYIFSYDGPLAKKSEVKQAIESGGGYSPEVEQVKENIPNKLGMDEDNIEDQAKQDNTSEVSIINNDADGMRIDIKDTTYIFDRSDKMYENDNEINIDLYFNKLPKKNNLITVNILGNVFNSIKSADNNLKEYSFVSTNQYDCKEKKARTLNLVSYEKINATGALINSPKFDTSWAPWTKENTERIQQKICN